MANCGDPIAVAHGKPGAFGAAHSAPSLRFALTSPSGRTVQTPRSRLFPQASHALQSKQLAEVMQARSFVA